MEEWQGEMAAETDGLGGKPEIRNPKSESNPKSQAPKENYPRRVTKEHEEEGRSCWSLVAGRIRMFTSN
jgi:hypothetical protein